MNCRDAEHKIFASRDCVLVTPERVALAEHVAQCPACRGMQARLADGIESWRVATQAFVPPDAGSEWESLRRRIRGGLVAHSLNSGGRRRRVVGWFAVPLGVAAAVALALFVFPPASSSTANDMARAASVEISAVDGSVVFVDDASGWVVIWEGEAGAKTI
jgi:predicted anti-sigma-YlaC factor YlaD